MGFIGLRKYVGRKFLYMKFIKSVKLLGLFSYYERNKRLIVFYIEYLMMIVGIWKNEYNVGCIMVFYINI